VLLAGTVKKFSSEATPSPLRGVYAAAHLRGASWRTKHRVESRCLPTSAQRVEARRQRLLAVRSRERVVCDGLRTRVAPRVWRKTRASLRSRGRQWKCRARNIPPGAIQRRGSARAAAPARVIGLRARLRAFVAGSATLQFVAILCAVLVACTASKLVAARPTSTHLGMNQTRRFKE
jgi:hypothetical protein